MEKKTTAEVVASIIIKSLEEGISPWHQPWKNGFPRSINGNQYRGWNALLLSMFTNYNDPRFLTFNKVRQLGGQVKKSEHGHTVVYWNFIEKTEVDKETGNVTKKTIPLARTYCVFNVEQCSGLSVKPWKNAEIQTIPTAEKIWNDYAGKPELKHNVSRAFYSPSDDYISIPEIGLFSGAEEYYSTLFHEAVHSTGHKSRLNRELTGYYQNGEKYGREELVAEIGACLLCQSCGITRTLENSAAYCKSWAMALKQMPATAILSAAGTAQKAVDYITGYKSETQNAE